jgi:hypothetical protein
MSSLAELQHWLRGEITGVPGAPSCAHLLIEGDIPRARRIRAYADAFRVRLAEVLAIDFKGVRAVLGTDEFGSLATQYFAKHPSRSPNLAEFGRDLASYLRTLADVPPFLADLAELEWRLAEAYVAGDVAALDPASLALIEPDAWPGARFELDPSLSWLETQWPVLRLHRLASAERSVADAIPHRRRTERLLIYRDLAGDSHACRSEVAELRTLAALRAGACLSEITAELERSEGPAGAAKIQSWFQVWVERGLIRKVLIS